MEEYDDFSKIPVSFTGVCRIINDGIDNGVFHCKNRLFHCETGPSCFYDDGALGWKINGEFHRLDGPAFIVPDTALGSPDCGKVEYWIHGNQYTEEEYYRIPEVIKTLLKNVLKL